MEGWEHRLSQWGRARLSGSVVSNSDGRYAVWWTVVGGVLSGEEPFGGAGRGASLLTWVLM